MFRGMHSPALLRLWTCGVKWKFSRRTRVKMRLAKLVALAQRLLTCRLDLRHSRLLSIQAELWMLIPIMWASNGVHRLETRAQNSCFGLSLHPGPMRLASLFWLFVWKCRLLEDEAALLF